MNFKIEKHRDTHREMKLTREDRCEDNFSWETICNQNCRYLEEGWN